MVQAVYHDFALGLIAQNDAHTSSGKANKTIPFPYRRIVGEITRSFPGEAVSERTLQRLKASASSAQHSNFQRENEPTDLPNRQRPPIRNHLKVTPET